MPFHAKLENVKYTQILLYVLFKKPEKRIPKHPDDERIVWNDEIGNGYLTIISVFISSQSKSKQNLGDGFLIFYVNCFGLSFITSVADRRGWLATQQPYPIPLPVGSICMWP